MKRSKRIICLILSALIIMTMVGCDTKVSTGKKSIDIDKLANDLKSSITFDDDLTAVDKDMVVDLYEVDADVIKDVTCYMSSGATAEEIMVCEAVDVDAAKTMADACVGRIQRLTMSYKDYNPAEMDKLESTAVYTQDVYVVICVSPDAKAAKKIIEGAFDEMCK